VLVQSKAHRYLGVPFSRLRNEAPEALVETIETEPQIRNLMGILPEDLKNPRLLVIRVRVLG